MALFAGRESISSCRKSRPALDCAIGGQSAARRDANVNSLCAQVRIGAPSPSLKNGLLIELCTCKTGKKRAHLVARQNASSQRNQIRKSASNFKNKIASKQKLLCSNQVRIFQRLLELVLSLFVFGCESVQACGAHSKCESQTCESLKRTKIICIAAKSSKQAKQKKKAKLQQKTTKFGHRQKFALNLNCNSFASLRFFLRCANLRFEI